MKNHLLRIFWRSSSSSKLALHHNNNLIVNKMSSSSTSNVAENLKVTLDKISEVYEECAAENSTYKRASAKPRLVAISKTKPITDIIDCYNSGQRVFGENYIQELVEKSNDEELLKSCPDIKWHFVGNCQSNKVSKLLQCPNLDVMETVDSLKKADKIQNQCQSQKKSLKIMIQINSSGEEQKNGISPNDSLNLIRHVLNKCPNLKFIGLMTIGSLAASMEKRDENQDFIEMISLRQKVSLETEIPEEDIELSMGMSNDFEQAIKMGSTSVRVGSKIFGARNYPPK